MLYRKGAQSFRKGSLRKQINKYPINLAGADMLSEPSHLAKLVFTVYVALLHLPIMVANSIQETQRCKCNAYYLFVTI